MCSEARRGQNEWLHFVTASEHATAFGEATELIPTQIRSRAPRHRRVSVLRCTRERPEAEAAAKSAAPIQVKERTS